MHGMVGEYAVRPAVVRRDVVRHMIRRDRVHVIELRQHFESSMLVVFKAITNHSSMGQWLTGVRVKILREGTPHPNGVGAVRLVCRRVFAVMEEVVYWEEPTSMAYRILGDTPLRNHLGELRLSPANDGGTNLHYKVQFTVPWYFGGSLLGVFVTRRLSRNLKSGLIKLASLLRSLPQTHD